MNRLVDLETAKDLILQEQVLMIAADRELLEKLPKGRWIGGTIPYFMGDQGGVITRDQLFVTTLQSDFQLESLKTYSCDNLEDLLRDAPENGASFMISPGLSEVHAKFALDVTSWPDFLLKPLVGWASGLHLDDLGKDVPAVYFGPDGSRNTNRIAVMHCSLPQGKGAKIGIINFFEQGNGDEIYFDSAGYEANECIVNGEKQNLYAYLKSLNHDSRFPLVADYYGARVNAAFASLDESGAKFYGPLFPNTPYRLAKPIDDFAQAFATHFTAGDGNRAFSCNCILNFLYAGLEGKNTGGYLGPITFGEIAFQLMTETLVYMDVVDLA